MSNNPEEEGDHISYMRGQYQRVPKPERLLDRIVPRQDGKGFTYLAVDTASSLVFCDEGGKAVEAYTGIERDDGVSKTHTSSPQGSNSVDIFSSDRAGIDLPSPQKDDSSFAKDFYNSGRNNNNYYANLDGMEDFDFHQADRIHVDRIH